MVPGRVFFVCEEVKALRWTAQRYSLLTGPVRGGVSDVLRVREISGGAALLLRLNGRCGSCLSGSDWPCLSLLL